MKQLILNKIDDMVSKLLYYDRKEDEDLPREAIEKAISNNEITVEEIMDKFRESFLKGISE